jgi:ubiquinone/menaquinone biosynthesis C-methylase UbiE
LGRVRETAGFLNGIGQRQQQVAAFHEGEKNRLALNLTGDKDELKKLITNANKEFYNNYATTYNELEHGVLIAEDDRRLNGLFNEFSNKSGNENYLDVGCGTGNLLKIAKVYFKRITGIDISEEMLKLSRKYTDELYCANAEAMPFEDNTFNVITANSVLHHFYDPGSVIKEMYRVCKPGGTVFTDNDPNRTFKRKFSFYNHHRQKLHNKKTKKAVSDVNKFEEVHRLAEYHHFYTDWISGDDLKKIFLQHGFKDVTVSYRYHAKPNLFSRFVKLFFFLSPREIKCPFIYVIAKK